MSEYTQATSKRDLWVKRLKREEEAHKEWRDQAKDAEEAFFADKKNTEYPLFWPTVKVLHARIYSQPPKPDVRKRYQDDPGSKPVAPEPGMAGYGNGVQPFGNSPQNAPSGGLGGAPNPAQVPQVDDNKLAQCIERALTYTIDTTDFDADGHAAVNDLLIAGLGIAKVELETETELQPIINPVTQQPIIGEDGKPMTKEVISSQKVKLKSFSWSQFHWEPQQHWAQVSWVAFDHWMTADEIEDEFGIDISSDKANGPGAGSPNKPKADKYKALFCVHELWNKTRRERIFLTEDYPDLLREDKDPLGLEDFFPCPKPMMTNIKGDDLVPKPDYTYCQPQFKYVNVLSGRISRLTRQIKDIGFYDPAMGEVAQLSTCDDGDLIPVANLAARIEALGAKGRTGYDAVVSKQDNTGKVQVVQELMSLRDMAKQNIWETYGVSDIQRGQTNPNETATAQNIKAQWADIRVGERVRIVSLFFRDVFRIQAEIIAEHFQPQMLEKMTGVALNPQEMQVLRSDLGRCYAIDVESDSTVVQDEFAQKQQRMEFLTSVTGYIKEILPAVQQGIMPADLGKELLLFAANTFKNGRQLEDAINALPGTQQQIMGMQQQIQQAQQQGQQLQQQLQDAQKQLQAVNAGKEQRENVKTASDAQAKAADTQKTEVETAQIAQHIGHSALQPVQAAA
jgi:hypothetical protein